MTTAMIALAFFPALLVLAAVYDLTTMTIPNWLNALVVLSFVLFAPMTGMGLEAMLGHLGAGALMFAIGIMMFALGWMGGGDAKLIAGVAMWCGWSALMPFLVLAAIFGGILTVAIVLTRTMPLPPFLCRIEWVMRLHDRHTGVPYGIALAAAGLLIYQDLSLFPLLHTRAFG